MLRLLSLTMNFILCHLLQIRETEMVGTYSTYEKVREHKIVVRKHVSIGQPVGIGVHGRIILILV
jgi:hypothetical protein